VLTRRLPRTGRAHLQEPERAPQHAPPMIVRINDVGHAEAIDYRTSSTGHRKRRQVLPHPLGGLYFSRNRFTIEATKPLTLFLNSDVTTAVIDQERKDNSIQNYVRQQPAVMSMWEIKNVVLDDMRQSPYRRGSSSRSVHQSRGSYRAQRERWTASVTYVFRENVKNSRALP